MEALVHLEIFVHVHLDGQEQGVQVSTDRLIGKENLSNDRLVTFQHRQPVQLATLDKQEQAHVSISKLT